MCEHPHYRPALALPAANAASAPLAHVLGTNPNQPPAPGRCVATQQALATDPDPDSGPGQGGWPGSAAHHRAGMVLPNPQPATGPRRLSRVRLWELPHKYHCPVIGTCVTVDELRSLARKAGAVQRGERPSDYEVHVSFVAAADGKNPLSAAVQKALERKFATTVRRFAHARTPGAVLALWQVAVADGQIPAAFWAVMTHAAADAEVRAQAYEDVHMLSHQIGAGLNADLEALAETRATLARERRECVVANRRAAAQQAAQQQTIIALQNRLTALANAERELAETRERVRALETGDALRQLWERITELETLLAECTRLGAAARSEAASAQERLATLTQCHAAQQARLAEREASCDALERLLLTTNTGLMHGSSAALPKGDSMGDCAGDPAYDCDGDCARCGQDAAAPLDLAGRRILCVGGRGSLATRYRELVAACNGELVRHDGGLEDNRARLETLLGRVDAVVCPTDQVSHDAYHRTKRYCKRNAIPCVLLERSGVGAFARALAALAAETWH